MTPKTKAELISIFHTFIAVFIPIFMVNLGALDFTNLTKESLTSFGIAILRSVVKTMWNTYKPQIDTAINAPVDSTSVQAPVVG